MIEQWRVERKKWVWSTYISDKIILDIPVSDNLPWINSNKINSAIEIEWDLGWWISWDTEYWDCGIIDTSIPWWSIPTDIVLSWLTTNSDMSLSWNTVIINKDWRYTINISWYFKFGWWWNSRFLRIKIGGDTVLWDSRIPLPAWTFISISRTWTILSWQAILLQWENDDTVARTFSSFWLNVTKV